MMETNFKKSVLKTLFIRDWLTASRLYCTSRAEGVTKGGMNNECPHPYTDTNKACPMANGVTCVMRKKREEDDAPKS